MQQPARPAASGADLVARASSTATAPTSRATACIDVGAAWNVLRQTVKPVDITSSVAGEHGPVAASSPRPGRGQGIYDREGVDAGTTYTRTYTFTRTSGGGRPSPTT